MSELTDEVCELIERSTSEEQRIVLNYLRQRTELHPLEEQWGTTAEAILTAIARSSDLTQRGIRGILAEATFEGAVLPKMASSGWNAITITGDQTYDFLLQREEARVRIQVKLQRREGGVPKQYAARARASLNCPTGTMYVVEVQRTRSGERNGEKTRPYRFGDFDILAVNMHPSSGDWKQFMYIVASRLLPRPQQPGLIEIFQPVPTCPDDFWTDDLGRCVDSLLTGASKRLYS